MVGDVNLFLTDLEDPTLGEIEVMIAGLSHQAWPVEPEPQLSGCPGVTQTLSASVLVSQPLVMADFFPPHAQHLS